MQKFILLTISSENSSADIAYFPRNFLLTNEIDGTAWTASAFGELDCWSSLSEISLLHGTYELQACDRLL